MNATVPFRLRPDLIALPVAILVSMFLFYIDEGNYNFNYLTEIGNLIVLVVYITGIWVGQLLVHVLLFKNSRPLDRVIYNALLGVPLGIALTIGLFFLYAWMRGASDLPL
jgi:hypothetical protein